jgi:hypothetical protein
MADNCIIWHLLVAPALLEILSNRVSLVLIIAAFL